MATRRRGEEGGEKLCTFCTLGSTHRKGERGEEKRRRARALGRCMQSSNGGMLGILFSSLRAIARRNLPKKGAVVSSCPRFLRANIFKGKCQ